jgi:membrane protease YdiL (CAAX protease family)
MNTNSTFIQRFSLPLYLILTPLLSLAVPLFLSLPTELVPLMMIFIPALMAILLTSLSEGRKGVIALLQKHLQWRMPFKWLAIPLGLAFSLRLAMSLLALLFGWIPTIQFNAWSPQQFIMIGVFTLIGAVMEELGWRGYALPKLLSQRSALASALLIGIPWGILHIGLILPGQMNAGTSGLETVLYIVALSVVLTWLFVQTRGNLVVVILYHAGENFFVFLNGGISITQSLRLLNIVTIALAIGLIILYGVNLQRDFIKKRAVVNPAQVESE